MRRKRFFAIAVSLTCAGWPLTALSEGANGQMLAQACVGCHGASWDGQGAITDLRGYDRDSFLRVWEEFRTDERPATIMNRITRGYTEAEVAALADFFASLD